MAGSFCVVLGPVKRERISQTTLVLTASNELGRLVTNGNVGQVPCGKIRSHKARTATHAY